MAHLWFPLYDGDLLVDTMHLNATAFGAYMRLLIHAYNHHGEIPLDDELLRVITHTGSRWWSQHRDTVLAFFEPCAAEHTNDVPTAQHKRVVAELHRSHEISNKRRAAAQQMLSNRSAKASANGGVITAQHNKKEPQTTLARSNGSGGRGPQLSQEEQNRLIAAYERLHGKTWLETTRTGGTISEEKPTRPRT